ncbi:MAG: hypothetical protein KAR40_11225 [Candidatus Sabulitectum sp.]|nr:hypothetical protein [Candidatus Sabulitectum sp.]
MKLVHWLWLVIFIDFAIGVAHYLNLPFDDGIVMAMQFFTQSALLAFVVFILVPVKHLMAKTLMWAFFLSEVFETIMYPLPDEYYWTLFGLHVAMFVVWILFIMRRDYKLNKTVAPHSEKVYRVAHKPDCYTDFFLSLGGLPIGGSGVFFNGKLHSFHHGEFNTFDRVPAGAVFIATDLDPNCTKINAVIDKHIGTKWRLFFPPNNCVTLWWRLYHA